MWLGLPAPVLLLLLLRLEAPATDYSMNRVRFLLPLAVCALLWLSSPRGLCAEDAEALAIRWKDNWLTVSGPRLPGGSLRVHYLEAFCRPGSTNRDWNETTIPHTTEQVSADEAGRIVLRSRLADGVVVEHVVTAAADAIDFRLTLHNPTDKASEADWFQPCIRVDAFTGKSQVDYVPSCFIFLDGKPARLPTQPWATEARYTPGQVYAAAGVNRNDVNPRPLSERIPSNGLMGCTSADGKWVLATAWDSWQELFQGVGVCIHSDPRIGGLQPGETKRLYGKIYIVPADLEKLVERYERDFGLE